MNFISAFNELDKLYEEFDNENGATNWSKAVIGYYTQAAKELGLANFDMKRVGSGSNAKVVVTAIKNGKNISAEESEEAVTHQIKSAAEAKDHIKVLFPDLAESLELTEAAEEEEIEIVDDAVPAEEIPTEEPIDDEPRQLILECDKCGAIVIRDEDKVVVDEESDLANIEDECEFCEETKGYKIIGVVAPYEVVEESVEEAPFDNVDVVPVEESLDTEVLEEGTGLFGAALDVVKRITAKFGNAKKNSKWINYKQHIIEKAPDGSVTAYDMEGRPFARGLSNVDEAKHEIETLIKSSKDNETVSES